MHNPLARIPQFGQSIWLDYIRRKFIASGELKKLVDEDGLRGITSNPAIFEEAIAKSDDYWDDLRTLAKTGKSNEDLFLALAIEDVQNAADILRPVYESTHGLDGYVSLEVSPSLALNTEGTVREARSSWAALNRPNVMIKVPGTKEGIPAIEQLISEGININVTLLFSLDRYRAVAEAYIKGMERRLQAGESLEKISSVASFFLSRIDTLVDTTLEKVIAEGGNQSQLAQKLYGQVAIASAKRAYMIYKELFAGERFRPLAERGANVQRLLWASTSTKNPAFDELKYVEALIGPDTVNTLPMETLKAYRKQGNPAARLEEGMEESAQLLQLLPEVGISLTAVTKQLEEEGIQKFIKPFSSLLKVIEEKREQAAATS